MNALETSRTSNPERPRVPAFSGSFEGGGGLGSVWGCFDRHGGVGCPPYDSANISFGVGDRVEDVKKNRLLTCKSLGLKGLASVHQVHGISIFHVKNPPEPGLEPQGYDALVTDLPDVGLMIQQADCQAVLLHDPENGAVAAIHCGWRGSVQGIIGLVVGEMKALFGTRPDRLNAVISPSLGPCCSEFIHHTRELPAEFLNYSSRENYFDFWKISHSQLVSCGVRAEAVEISGICTSCNSDYFSYRRSCREGSGATGRNCSVIALRQQTGQVHGAE